MFLTLDRRLAGGRGAFFVQARAEELASLGCVEGDYILLEPVAVTEVADGSIVAASVEGRSAYYRFNRGKQTVFLHPLVGKTGPTALENPEGLILLGRITGIYRRMDHLPAAVTAVAH
jgi:SOS-response transcriptional repressor LexA